MTGVEEKAVSHLPARILRVILQEFGKEHIDIIGTTHGATGVT